MDGMWISGKAATRLPQVCAGKKGCGGSRVTLKEGVRHGWGHRSWLAEIRAQGCKRPWQMPVSWGIWAADAGPGWCGRGAQLDSGMPVFWNQALRTEMKKPQALLLK